MDKQKVSKILLDIRFYYSQLFYAHNAKYGSVSRIPSTTTASPNKTKRFY